jgi:protein SCO1/2
MRTLVPMLVVLLATFGAETPASAQVPPMPPELQGTEITEHLGAKLPLDLHFVNEQAEDVTLRDFFRAGRPVLLTMNYFECPMLCSMVLDGLINGLKALDWSPGREFDIVTVSINHREGPALALAKKKTHVEALGKPTAEQGWHFLTGSAENIKQLAETVGFGYRWDPTQMQYAHGAGIMFISPEGVVSRYLYGIQYPEDTLRMALLETSQGKLGSVVDKFILYCFHYVPSSRRYEFYIWGAMRLGGVLTILGVGTMLAVFWRRERRLGLALAAAPTPTDAVTRA